jgi:hypothetical protein
MNSVSTAGAKSNLQAVPSSGRQLITADSANQSTNLGAVNLPAVIKPGDRRYLIGGSHARVIIGGDQAAPLRLGREKRGDEPAQDPLKCRCYGANGGQAPLGSNIEALFIADAAFFLERLLRRIVQILLRFVSRNKRLRGNRIDQVSSNQLVPSKPQERPQ